MSSVKTMVQEIATARGITLTSQEAEKIASDLAVAFLDDILDHKEAQLQRTLNAPTPAILPSAIAPATPGQSIVTQNPGLATVLPTPLNQDDQKLITPLQSTPEAGEGPPAIESSAQVAPGQAGQNE